MLCEDGCVFFGGVVWGHGKDTYLAHERDAGEQSLVRATQSCRRRKAEAVRLLAAGLVRVVVGGAIRSGLGNYQKGHSAAVAAHKDCEVHAIRRQNQGEGALMQVQQGAIGSWS